jgi:hypothetical protein
MTFGDGRVPVPTFATPLAAEPSRSGRRTEPPAPSGAEIIIAIPVARPRRGRTAYYTRGGHAAQATADSDEMSGSVDLPPRRLDRTRLAGLMAGKHSVTVSVRIDPTRVRHPKDKLRVERNVFYSRRSMFAGDLHRSGRRRASRLPVVHDHGRATVHGTIEARPAEVFAAQEQPCPHRPSLTTCPSTPPPRSTPSTTSKWPGFVEPEGIQEIP